MDVTKREGKKAMTVSQTPGFRFTDLDADVQSMISAMRQSQICLESWDDLSEDDREFHFNIVSRCAEELRKVWYPSK